MTNPLVTVIVPVYNGAAYLGEALASVRAQTYGRVELIVVDDGSNDASPEIAASYRPAQRVRQDHQGAAAARNHGLKLARGSLLAFLDQDDWWEPHKLQRQVSYLQAHPEIDWVTARQMYFISPGAGTPLWLSPEQLEKPQPGRTPSALLARKTLFDRLGPFDEALTDTSDAEWFARAEAAGARHAEIPEALVHRRVHADNYVRLT